jgi:hypothetical protein
MVGVSIDEISCPGCDELVQYDAPLGVEALIIRVPAMTSAPSATKIIVGGAVVHECDPDDAQDEVVARGVGEVLRDAGPSTPPVVGHRTWSDIPHQPGPPTTFKQAPDS